MQRFSLKKVNEVEVMKQYITDSIKISGKAAYIELNVSGIKNCLMKNIQNLQIKGSRINYSIFLSVTYSCGTISHS
jgi:hypothetical protein